MIKNYRNYTSCIYSNNLELIEHNITKILEKEGCQRINKPSLPMSCENLRRESWRLMREFWIIGLFVGSDGWTILKIAPNELFCRRAINSNHSRLSQLAKSCNCNIFHFGAYNSFCILLEVNADGCIYISGGVDRIDEEANKFYEENIDSSDIQFHLLDVPENFKKAVNYITREERERERQRIDEIFALLKEETKEIEGWRKLSKEEQEKEIQKQANGQEIIYSYAGDLLDELDDLLIGKGVRIDFNFIKIFQDSHWCLKTKDCRRTNDLYDLAYTRQEQLEAEGAKLLYFNPPKYYRQLKYYSEIATKY